MKILTGMLFLDGHIAHPDLAVSLAAPPSPAITPPATPIPDPSEPGTLLPARRHPMNLFQSLMFLGGRPMTAGHNDDIEEPFPRVYGNRAATRQWLGLAPRQRRTREKADMQPPTQLCATC